MKEILAGKVFDLAPEGLMQFPSQAWGKTLQYKYLKAKNRWPLFGSEMPRFAAVTYNVKVNLIGLL